MGPNPDALILEILTTPAGRDDPYSRYRTLREVAPIHRSPDAPIVYLSRYDDCRGVLHDPALGKHPADAVSIFGTATSEEWSIFRRTSMLFLDPPDHTRLRGLVSRAFTPHRIEALTPAIEALLEPILDDMAALGNVDAMDRLAFHLPVAVIGELVGVPPSDREQFRQLVRDTAALIEPASDSITIERASDAHATMREYFADLIRDQRRRDRDDLLGALMRARDGRDRLSTDELISTVILLFAAGFETTTNLIGNGLLALLRHPHELDALRTGASSAREAVDEILRYDSPVQLDARYAHLETHIGGVTIAPGDTVITFLGAANRDPERFTEPDAFRANRTDNHPLSFGWGIHHCLGAHLARTEGVAVFTGLLRRFPSIELADPDPPQRPSFTLRGLEELWVNVA